MFSERCGDSPSPEPPWGSGGKSRIPVGLRGRPWIPEDPRGGEPKEDGSNNEGATAKGAPPAKKPKLAQHLRRDPEIDNYAFLGRAPRKEIIVEEAPKTEWERYLAVEEIDISIDLLVGGSRTNQNFQPSLGWHAKSLVARHRVQLWSACLAKLRVCIQNFPKRWMGSLSEMC